MKKILIIQILLIISNIANGFVTNRRFLPNTNGGFSRLSSAEPFSSYHFTEPQGPGTYSFGYEYLEPNAHFRDEERHPNGTVTGSYGHVDGNGILHTVKYVADHLGYRAKVEEYPSGTRPPTTQRPVDFTTEKPKDKPIIPLPGIVQPQRPFSYNIIGQSKPLRVVKPQQHYAVVPQTFLTYQQPFVQRFDSYQRPVFGFY